MGNEKRQNSDWGVHFTLVELSTLVHQIEWGIGIEGGRVRTLIRFQ